MLLPDAFLTSHTAAGIRAFTLMGEIPAFALMATQATVSALPPQRTLQPWHAAALLEYPPGFAGEAASSAVEDFARFCLRLRKGVLSQAGRGRGVLGQARGAAVPACVLLTAAILGAKLLRQGFSFQPPPHSCFPVMVMVRKVPSRGKRCVGCFSTRGCTCGMLCLCPELRSPQ